MTTIRSNYENASNRVIVCKCAWLYCMARLRSSRLSRAADDAATRTKEPSAAEPNLQTNTKELSVAELAMQTALKMKERIRKVVAREVSSDRPCMQQEPNILTLESNNSKVGR